jgi:hypothetical protein
MSKKIILFVPSYMQIPGMLHFIEKYKFDSEINIYTGLKDLYKFTEYFNNIFWGNKIKCFYIKVPSYYNAGAKNKNIIMKIINFIKYLSFTNKMKIKLYNKYFKNKRGYKVYFFTIDHFTSTNCEPYYIKKLSDNNCIYLMNITPLQLKLRKILFKEYTLRLLIKSLVDKFVFDKHLELFRFTKNCAITHMSKTYIKKYVSCELEYAQYAKDVNKSYNKYSRRLSSKYAKYRMIFFDQRFGSNILIQNEKEIFIRKLKEIFIKYFGEKFAVKYHPGASKMESTLNFNNIESKNILKQFIPGECFYNKNTKYYISYFSDTITDKQNYTHPNNIRISLSYLLPFKEEYIRENLISMFKSRIKGMVLFPKSFAELEDIFKGEVNVIENQPLD